MATVMQHMKKFAIVVGVDRYADGGMNGLRYAVRDAQQIGGLLANLPEPFQVKYFTNDRDLNRSHLSEELGKLRSALEPGDSLLLYFAGHACQSNGEHLLLLPQAQMNLLQFREEVLPVPLLLALTDVPGVHRALILDACRTNLETARATTIEGFVGAAQLRDVVARAARAKNSSITLFCSCADGQQAQEHADIEGGLFTAALHAALQQRRQQGLEMRLDDGLEGEIRRRMQQLAEVHGLDVNQRPWIARCGEVVCLAGGRAQALPPEAPIPMGQKLTDLRELAFRGDMRAQFELGECYTVGRGGAVKDLEAAKLWYGKAAEAGHSGAWYQLGHLTELEMAGEPVGGRNAAIKVAASFYQKSARLGHPYALNRLGEIAAGGLDGTPADHAQAFGFFQQAALCGYHRAQFQLGRFFLLGLGAPSDPGAAQEWLQRSANQNFERAVKLLQELREIGGSTAVGLVPVHGPATI